MNYLLKFLLFFIITNIYSAEDLYLLYMAQAGYQPKDIIERTTEFYNATGIRIITVFAEYEDIYDMIIASSKNNTAAYDIILLDLIWTGDFVKNKIIEPVPVNITQTVRDKIIPEIYTPFYQNSRLWAMPFLANFQLFYTNMDLLKRVGFSKPPATLEEMLDMALEAKNKGLIKFPIFESLNKQEALICEYVWLLGAFGGNLSDSQGNINLLHSENKKALDFLIDLLNKGLLNPYSLQADELFAADVFGAGDCLFTTNWTFLSGLLVNNTNKDLPNWQLSAIPIANEQKGNISTSTISGFQGLAVTSNSKNKTAAWRVIQFLVHPDFQRKHLEEMSVWKEIWDDPETLKKDSFINIKKAQILGVQHRPTNYNYIKISGILQEYLYKALKGEISTEKALSLAQDAIVLLK